MSGEDPKTSSSTDDRLARLEEEFRQRRIGIWLEVAEVQFDSASSKDSLEVQLKGDRAHPRSEWWPVDATIASTLIAGAKPDPYEAYKAILNEMDKKRTVLARLSCHQGDRLRCDALRFQSPEVGGRTF